MSDTANGQAVQSDELLDALRSSRYPNCTLYLIWHHVQRGDMEAARLEYACDYDKLGCHRATVETVLSSNDTAHRQDRSASGGPVR